MKERILDVIKWGLILVIAGGIFHFFNIKNQYTIVSTAKGIAYKMKNRTGEVWLISPMGEELINSSNDSGKNQPLAGDEKFSDKSDPLDLFKDEKPKSLLDKVIEERKKEQQKNNE
jgi:hypothetical protein